MKSHLTENDARLLRMRIGRWYSARVAYEWDLPQMIGPQYAYECAVNADPTDDGAKLQVAKIKRAIRRIEKNFETSTALLEGLINRLEGKAHADQPE